MVYSVTFMLLPYCQALPFLGTSLHPAKQLALPSGMTVAWGGMFGM
jgi:hypothetical protein